MVTPCQAMRYGPRLRSARVSQRRACKALFVDRSGVRYTSTRPDDAVFRAAMKTVAAERRRFGYRRIHILLERQGMVMNQKKLRRLYREEKLRFAGVAAASGPADDRAGPDERELVA
ncbi:transposase [Mesorhizobium waimense]|uniref:Transposase n=1 Tax=Mesorhizobium waimense TaxID=1300307 RepID=A0A3A5JUD7_9HYPH|nr:transposase [Mesorhizobium waimense]